MFWPSLVDYSDAIQSPAVNLRDPELAEAEVATDHLGLPRVASGNFASVYRLNRGDESWAVKCFFRNIPERHERYRKISEAVQHASVPYLIPCDYQDEGIYIGSDWYPILKMPWVEGVHLNQFLVEHLDHPGVLRKVAQVWLSMLRGLRGAGIAHGDLQHGNVLIVGDRLRLVDYDGMYVPALEGAKSLELGHPEYQHPRRGGAFGPHLDRFPGLVIYTALRALSYEPRLWTPTDSGENLLFRRSDYEAPSESKLFATLRQCPQEEVRALAEQVQKACSVAPDAVPDVLDLADPDEVVVCGRSSAEGLPPWLAPLYPEAQPTPTPEPEPEPEARPTETIEQAPRPEPVLLRPWRGDQLPTPPEAEAAGPSAEAVPILPEGAPRARPRRSLVLVTAVATLAMAALLVPMVTREPPAPQTPRDPPPVEEPTERVEEPAHEQGSEREAEADTAYVEAREFQIMNQGQVDAIRQKYQAICDKYPATRSAEKARVRLTEIQTAKAMEDEEACRARLDEARSLVEQERFAEAIALYKLVQVKYPKTLCEHHAASGIAAAETGAEHAFSRVKVQASAAVASGDFDKARALYERVIRVHRTPRQIALATAALSEIERRRRLREAAQSLREARDREAARQYLDQAPRIESLVKEWRFGEAVEKHKALRVAARGTTVTDRVELRHQQLECLAELKKQIIEALNAPPPLYVRRFTKQFGAGGTVTKADDTLMHAKGTSGREYGIQWSRLRPDELMKLAQLCVERSKQPSAAANLVVLYREMGDPAAAKMQWESLKTSGRLDREALEKVEQLLTGRESAAKEGKEGPPRATEAEVRLRIEVAGATEEELAAEAPSVRIDGKSVPLTGLRASAVVLPGSHVIEVTRNGCLRLRERVEITAAGLDATVRLVAVRTVVLTTFDGREWEVVEDKGDGWVVISPRGKPGRLRIEKSHCRGFRSRQITDGESSLEWVPIAAPPAVTGKGEIDLGGGTTLELVRIPPGEFPMGSSSAERDRRADEGPQHLVRITKGFSMGKYEVTQGQWEAVMGGNPSRFKGDGRRPVENVSWNDCQEFLKKLNGRVSGGGFRLPTEAEWEYACRAGTTTRFYWGDDRYYAEMRDYAWGSRTGSSTHAVGGKKPNAWGLCDMNGNVWEWCNDWYGSYRSGAHSDPTGPSSGSARVLRGGSWGCYPTHCRSASRNSVSPTYRYSSIGLRVARSPGE